MSGKIGQTGGPSSNQPSGPERSKDTQRASEKDVERFGDVMGDKKEKRADKPQEGKVDEKTQRMTSLSKDILSNESKKLSPKEQVVKDAISAHGDKNKEIPVKKELKKEDLSQGKIAEKGEGTIPVQGQQIQPQSVQQTGQVSGAQQSMAPQDVGKIATELVDRMLTTLPSAKTGVQEARISLKSDVAGNLKGTEVVVRTEKVGDRIDLQIGFTVSKDNPSAFGVLRAGEAALVQQLKNELPAGYELKGVDINQQGGENRRSKGEYIPEPTEE